MLFSKSIFNKKNEVMASDFLDKISKCAAPKSYFINGIRFDKEDK